MTQRLTMQAADLLACALLDLGVRHVFGIPGKAVYPLMMALDRCDLTFVLARHEAGAGFAAAGYAMAGDTIGVAIGTSGPGGTNMLTAAGQAKSYSAPVLFITGHPSAGETGKPFAQDSSVFGTDLVELFKPVAKFSASVGRAGLLRGYLEHAVHAALAPPRGPVHLNIPMDVLSEQTAPFHISVPIPDRPISSHIDEAAGLMRAAKRPLILAGKGMHSSRAYAGLSALADRLQIPVATTPGGKGAFPTSHPLSLGGYGLGGSAAADRYVEAGVDLLIVLGSKLTEMTVPDLKPQHYPERIVHFDWDPGIIGKSLPVPSLPVVGDIGPNLDAVLQRLGDSRVPAARGGSSLEPAASAQSAVPGKWSAASAARLMSRTLGKDTILFGDCGSHSFYAIEHYEIEVPGTFYFDDVFAAMGNAIAAAIGAKLALPGKPVVCLTGDGCMMMHGMELSTAVNAGLDIGFVVFNNKQLDMVDKSLRLGYGKSVGSRFAQPVDFAKFAESVGAIGIRCRNETELERALIGLARPQRRPTVIEVMLPEDEVPSLIRKRMNKS